MPISISYYVRQTPTDNSFGIAPTAQSAEPAAPTILTQRGARFTGYRLAHDSDGNVILSLPPQAWLNQPATWARRSTVIGEYDLRAP